MTSDLPRKMIRRATVPVKADSMAGQKFHESYYSGDSPDDDDFYDEELKYSLIDYYIFNIETDIFNIETDTLVDVLGDSGAAMHVWPSNRTGSGFKTAFMANGAKCEINDIRDVNIQDELGTAICLKNAHSVKGVTKRIISINALRKDGWKLVDNGNAKHTSLVKDNCCITFTEKKNNLHYLQAVQVSEGINNIQTIPPGDLPSTLTCPKGYKTMNINLFHDLHGHDGLPRMKAKAKHLCFHLTGNLKSCDACLAVKTKAKPIQRKTTNPATAPNEQMFLDTTGPFKVRTGTCGKLTNLFLFGLSDKFSSKMLFGFGTKKSELINFVRESWDVCKGRNLPIKHINMDNAGENLAVEDFCRKNNVDYKFTPPDTPKLNGQIERQFAIRLQKAMVLMVNAGLNKVARSNRTILMEAIKTASFLYDECPQANDESCPNEKWYSEEYKVRVKPEHYVQFGRIGFVANKRTHVKKNETRSNAMMMVGYALNSPSGTYRMYHPRTNLVIETNSVGWKDFTKGDTESVSILKAQLHESGTGGKITIDDDDNDDDVTTANDIANSSATNDTFDGTISTEPTSRPVTRSMTTATRAVAFAFDTIKDSTPSTRDPSPDAPTDPPAATPNFIVTGNTEPTRLAFESDALSIHHTCIQSDPGTLESWRSAIESPEREFWIKSMTAEFNNFLFRGAWEFVPLQEVRDKERKVIPTKLVF